MIPSNFKCVPVDGQEFESEVLFKEFYLIDANKPVDFTTAKLLKEKGFDGKSNGNFNLIGVYTSAKYNLPNLSDKQDVYILTDWNNFTDMAGNSEYYTAPTIAEVVMWFKDVKKIQLFLDFNYYDGFHYGIKWVISNGKFGEIWRDNNEYPDGYDSWEEAYEAAFEYLLNNTTDVHI